MLTDLPGYGGGVYCTDYYSTNHTINQCPTKEEMAEYTGRHKDLYDELTAILRNYGYDDAEAVQLMEVLEDEN